jgi:hypothetical protein
MTFEIERKKFTKEHLWVVRFTIDSTEYVFCENRSPVPKGLDAIPTLKGVKIAPVKIDLKGGLGVRGSATLNFDHHMDYQYFGTLSSPQRFWPVFRANYPYYQNVPITIEDGYIVNGEYKSENFQSHVYIIHQFKISQTGASIVAKDPLKLADSIRNKIPAASTGKLLAAITDTATSFTLSPSGVGDSEYPASGFIRISSEVMSFTRSGDAMTIVRSQYNTVAKAHNQDDVVQLCYYSNEQVQEIVYDILVNYAGIDSSYINKTEWDSEADIYLPGLLDGIITRPEGINAILKELGEQAPHYLYWDDRVNAIKFTAVKEPPTTANQLTDEANFIEKTFSFSDLTDERVSRVYVNFGQIDPTKKLDEYNNYNQTHVRVDTNSESNYGSPSTKIINSRWINSSNKAAAVLLAARIGRRFSDIPILFNFKLEPKDGDRWTGEPIFINSAELGVRQDIPAQIISARIATHYEYQAYSHGWGDEMPEDSGITDPNTKIVILSGEIHDSNLRTIYDTLFPTPVAADEITFIIESTCVAGATTSSAYGIDTGLWPEPTTPITIDIRGYVVGKGGGQGSINGGTAINMQADIQLNNTGVIGGGGGAGGFSVVPPTGPGQTAAVAAGGGGAGFDVGIAAVSAGWNVIQADDGTLTTGGSGGYAEGTNGTASGGDGGNLGFGGTNGTPNTVSAGTAGKAINLNGNTITYINTGTISGVVS